MALNDVKFVTTAGGLGRLPAEKDHVSAIIISLAATPAGWTSDGTPLGKKYLSLDEAEADGIVEGSANFGLLWYFIREFFRMAGAAELYAIDAAHGTFNAQAVFNMSGGEIRQVYYHTATAFAGIATMVGTVQTFCTALANLYAPCVALTNVIDNATAVTGSIADLRALNSPDVSVLIGGDGSGLGFDIATDLSNDYTPAGGTVLGLLARAKVHENIGWVAPFNVQQGADFDTVILADGQEVPNVAAATLDTINTRGYLFLRKHTGIAGAYLNDSHAATAATSDFAYIENNRTIQKAKRNIRAALLPTLNSPLTVNPDGTLSADTVKFFENLASRPLERMQAAGELSNFRVIIDPAQDVLATSTLALTVKLQPRGVARTITVTIGFEATV